ncbi:MAG: TRAP transporter large permease subunit [bacterium]|nr:TRAP transporter large permease subunit [bacterium]
MENKNSLPLLSRIENIFSYLILFLLAIIPFTEILTRKIIGTGIYGASDYIQHLVLWVTFIGGVITSREGKHLNLSLGIGLLKEPFKTWIKRATSFISILVLCIFTFCSLSFALIGFDPGQKVGLFPIRSILMILPLAYAVMTWYFIQQVPKSRSKAWIISLSLILGALFSLEPIIHSIQWFLTFLFPSGSWTDQFQPLARILTPYLHTLTWVAIFLLLLSALFGTPIFIVLGGLGLFFFIKTGGSIEVLPNEAYTMLTDSSLPALPLFTLAGYILSESKAGERLVRFFQALLSWLPGGMAIVSIIICAFFTTFTGASGVTILALGGLLSFILLNNKYPKKFTLGLLTASGSIGLLFPPSLPVIMYGVAAQINIKKMYVAGILPGLLMIITLIIMGAHTGMKNKVERMPVRLNKLGPAFIKSLGEILLPLIIIIGYFKGIITLVETGAVAVVYSLFLEVIIHKDIRWKDLSKIFLKSMTLIGGVLIILAGAKGLSYYIVDAEVPLKLVQWCQTYIHSKYVFLILLNIALLIVGCFMDIFSAIIVVVPLILPLGRAFGIDPIHLGIIFLANLELGYLTPPVGLNLYLASYTFEEPLTKIYRNVVPFLIVLLIDVLLITYLPGLTTVLFQWIKF